MRIISTSSIQNVFKKLSQYTNSPGVNDIIKLYHHLYSKTCFFIPNSILPATDRIEIFKKTNLDEHFWHI